MTEAEASPSTETASRTRDETKPDERRQDETRRGDGRDDRRQGEVRQEESSHRVRRGKTRENKRDIATQLPLLRQQEAGWERKEWLRSPTSFYVARCRQKPKRKPLAAGPRPSTNCRPTFQRAHAAAPFRTSRYKKKKSRYNTNRADRCDWEQGR